MGVVVRINGGGGSLQLCAPIVARMRAGVGVGSVVRFNCVRTDRRQDEGWGWVGGSLQLCAPIVAHPEVGHAELEPTRVLAQSQQRLLC
eukprot:6356764-Prymnesium_polylepis.1